MYLHRGLAFFFDPDDLFCSGSPLAAAPTTMDIAYLQHWCRPPSPRWFQPLCRRSYRQLRRRLCQLQRPQRCHPLIPRALRRLSQIHSPQFFPRQSQHSQLRAAQRHARNLKPMLAWVAMTLGPGKKAAKRLEGQCVRSAMQPLWAVVSRMSRRLIGKGAPTRRVKSIATTLALAFVPTTKCTPATVRNRRLICSKLFLSLQPMHGRFALHVTKHTHKIRYQGVGEKAGCSTNNHEFWTSTPCDASKNDHEGDGYATLSFCLFVCLFVCYICSLKKLSDRSLCTAVNVATT